MGKNKIIQSLFSDQVGRFGRKSRSGHLGHVGMTLVEVMVTMGVASTMMLGILQLITYANKSGKNLAVTSDWGNFVNSVQQSVNNDLNCQSMFQGMYFVGYKNKTNKGTAASGIGSMMSGSFLSAPPSLQQFVVDSGGTGTTPNPLGLGQGVGIIADGSALKITNIDYTDPSKPKISSSISIAAPKKKFENFTLDQILIEQIDTPQEITMVFPKDPKASNRKEYIFYIYPTQLKLTGTKPSLTGTKTVEEQDPKYPNDPTKKITTTVTVTGQSLTLGSQQLTTKQGIPFSLVTGPEKNIDGTAVSAANFPANPVTGTLPGPSVVFSCYGVMMSSAKACRDAGGVYDPGAPDGSQCSHYPYKLDNGNYSLPGFNAFSWGNSIGGARLILGRNNSSATITQPDDTAIGVQQFDLSRPNAFLIGQAEKTMWFNVGSATGNGRFQWHVSGMPLGTNIDPSNPVADRNFDFDLMNLDQWVEATVKPDGKTSVAEKSIALTLGPKLHGVDAYVDPAYPYTSGSDEIYKRDYTSIFFNGREGGVSLRSARRSEYLSNKAFPINFKGLDFQTSNADRLQIDTVGNVAIRPRDDGTESDLFFGKPRAQQKGLLEAKDDANAFNSGTWLTSYEPKQGFDQFSRAFEIGIRGVPRLQIGQTGDLATGESTPELASSYSSMTNNPAENCSYKAFSSGHFLYPSANCPMLTPNDPKQFPKRAILKFGNIDGSSLTSGAFIASVRSSLPGNVFYENLNGLDFYTNDVLRVSISGPGAANKPTVTIYGDLEVKGALIGPTNRCKVFTCPSAVIAAKDNDNLISVSRARFSFHCPTPNPANSYTYNYNGTTEGHYQEAWCQGGADAKDGATKWQAVTVSGYCAAYGWTLSNETAGVLLGLQTEGDRAFATCGFNGDKRPFLEHHIAHEGKLFHRSP